MLGKRQQAKQEVLLVEEQKKVRFGEEQQDEWEVMLRNDLREQWKLFGDEEA